MKVIFTHKNGRTQEMDEKHAKILSKVKRGTYQTRDMVAESTPPVINPPSQTMHSIAEQLTQSTELDALGVAWSADTHTATKIKNQDGTWRKKPGAKVESEGSKND